MKRKHISVLFLLGMLAFAVTVCRYPSQKAKADDIPAQRIYDYADILSETEEEELDEYIRSKEEQMDTDIRVFTDKMRMSEEKRYLEDWYDYLFDEELTLRESAALILVNMDENDRGVTIQGYGMMEDYLNNDRTEHVLDDIIPMFRAGNWKKGLSTFADEVLYYRNNEKGVVKQGDSGWKPQGESYGGPSDYYNPNPEVLSWGNFWDKYLGKAFFGSLILSAIIAAIIVSAQKAPKTSWKKVTQRTYLDTKHSGVTAKKDEFLYENTTKTYSPVSSSSSSSGGRSSGGGGISSGGHSHSGGSRRF